MKVKHYAGYGSVNMKKTGDTTEDNIKRIVVLVSGNHECGLVRTDTYDVFNWILKRFDRSVKDYRQIESVKCVEGWDDATHTDECQYTIEYRMH